MPVTDVLPPCGDDEPESNAGGPIDDGWESCPICDGQMREHATTCESCGHDFVLDAEGG